MQVLFGVPQGSVLGPFLFVIYINDLSLYVPALSVNYVDDTNFLLFGKRLAEIRDIVIKAADSWFETNRLVVNYDKTEEIVFSLSKKDNTNVKLLGIYLESRLNWETHTNNLCTRLSRVIFLLSKLRTCCAPELARNAYFAFFHSQLVYGITLWGNSPGAKEVFLWQKKAIRCIMGLGQRDSCRTHFNTLGILTVPSLFILNSLVYVKEHLPSLSLRNSIHCHNTRNNKQIDVNYARLTKTQKSFSFMGVKFFNKLPSAAKTVSMTRFKGVLEKWLKSKAFYSIAEMEEADWMNIVF